MEANFTLNATTFTSLMNLNNSRLRFGVLLFVLSASGCSRGPVVEPGISESLAIERKANIQNVSYDLYFNIPAARADSIPALATIHFQWIDQPQDLELDFQPPQSTIRSIQINGTKTAIRYDNEHLLVAKEHLAQKDNQIAIDFIAGEAALNRHDDFLYTLFVPSRASTCFPLFDQPDLKALYRLKLRIPGSWKAVSNGKIIASENDGDHRVIQFAETKPTSSYQFAFAVGNFRTATDPVSGMNIFYRETDSIKVSRNLAGIFELHRESLAWLTEYSGIAYPYDKFDFALIPGFQFGGMEHPGSIFYRESSLFLEPTASVNEELRRASLIAHETAHMWFGNLVTMQWFNDVWLKEVFANFMAAKIVSPSFPTVNHDLRFLMAHYPAAYEIDRSAGAHPIQQPLDNLRNAGSVYGAVIYQKAPIMMRNLEAWIGADNFQKGLRDYLKDYSYGNATWDDLIGKLKQYAKEDLEVWNRAWIKTSGMPNLEINHNTKGQSYLAITNDSNKVFWPQSVEYRITTKYIDHVQKVTFRNTDEVLLSKWVEPGMEFIPNYKGKGYGYFPGSSEYLMSQWSKQTEVEVRAGIWLNLWETFLREDMAPADFFREVLLAVEKENDPLLLEYLTDKLDRMFWQFLLPAERSLSAADMDRRLLERLQMEKDNSCKRTLFNVFRSVATSAEGVEALKKLWADEITFGLELSERDHIQLAYALALRQAPGSETTLKSQLSKVKNPDRRKEMEFVMPALSASPAVRDSLFERLKQKENRVREPWVLECVRYLNHPLRSERSVAHVRESLELLEELQRTGDIFFPKGWLDATLGSYQSAEAAEAVRRYLVDHHDLRQDLRNKLLQSADMLFRAEHKTNGGLAGNNR